MASLPLTLVLLLAAPASNVWDAEPADADNDTEAVTGAVVEGEEGLTEATPSAADAS